MFILKLLFSRIFRPALQQQCKTTVREPRWSQQNTAFVNLASLPVFRPGFNMTFKLLSSFFCCTVLPMRTEGIPVTLPRVVWTPVLVQLPLFTWTAFHSVPIYRSWDTHSLVMSQWPKPFPTRWMWWRSCFCSCPILSHLPWPKKHWN